MSVRSLVRGRAIARLVTTPSPPPVFLAVDDVGLMYEALCLPQPVMLSDGVNGKPVSVANAASPVAEKFIAWMGDLVIDRCCFVASPEAKLKIATFVANHPEVGIEAHLHRAFVYI